MDDPTPPTTVERRQQYDHVHEERAGVPRASATCSREMREGSLASLPAVMETGIVTVTPVPTQQTPNPCGVDQLLPSDLLY